ncbi:hypothetical protein EJ07DRAFT_152532 [Lizonia empirigonia]|nr:hypothetical protein EJ07DRAFT_152532 [Lizonia empirigonia]
MSKLGAGCLSGYPSWKPDCTEGKHEFFHITTRGAGYEAPLNLKASDFVEWAYSGIPDFTGICNYAIEAVQSLHEQSLRSDLRADQMPSTGCLHKAFTVLGTLYRSSESKWTDLGVFRFGLCWRYPPSMGLALLPSPRGPIQIPFKELGVKQNDQSCPGSRPWRSTLEGGPTIDEWGLTEDERRKVVGRETKCTYASRQRQSSTSPFMRPRHPSTSTKSLQVRRDV